MGRSIRKLATSCLLGAALAWTLPVFKALAHEGAEEEIDELTEQIQKEGFSADLLVRRALEYQILGKFAEAAADLEHALQLDQSSASAQRELSRSYFALGKTNEALTTVSKALQARTDDADRASLLMTRASILRPRREYARALEDANQAIALYPLNVEWYLVRSQLQRLQKEKAERVKGLEQGIRETGSGLLTQEWIDALIDGGRGSEALPEIEQNLQKSRWKSAWLIRRAKVRLAVGDAKVAQDDLKRALDELNKRLATSPTEALLLAERATVFDLLDNRADARRDYRAARDYGLADEWVRERIRALRDSPKDEE